MYPRSPIVTFDLKFDKSPEFFASRAEKERSLTGLIYDSVVRCIKNNIQPAPRHYLRANTDEVTIETPEKDDCPFLTYAVIHPDTDISAQLKLNNIPFSMFQA